MDGINQRPAYRIEDSPKEHHRPEPEPFIAPRTDAKSSSDQKETKKSRQFNLKKLAIFALIIVLLLGAVGSSVYFYNKYNDAQKQVKKLSAKKPTNAQALDAQQEQQIVKAVAKITYLPPGETPTIATVADTTKLTGQPFYANAQNGDAVLFYAQAKKAYLYRPSTNQIINIAPLITNDGQGTQPSSNSSGTTQSSTKKTP